MLSLFVRFETHGLFIPLKSGTVYQSTSIAVPELPAVTKAYRYLITFKQTQQNPSCDTSFYQWLYQCTKASSIFSPQGCSPNRHNNCTLTGSSAFQQVSNHKDFPRTFHTLLPFTTLDIKTLWETSLAMAYNSGLLFSLLFISASLFLCSYIWQCNSRNTSYK